ncbi:hypothetical protein Q3G72_020891 [Acer saccharum]|nr:hypothetical protein Q3G72_020891 [Acer saccharum]
MFSVSELGREEECYTQRLGFGSDPRSQDDSNYYIVIREATQSPSELTRDLSGHVSNQPMTRPSTQGARFTLKESTSWASSCFNRPNSSNLFRISSKNEFGLSRKSKLALA